MQRAPRMHRSARLARPLAAALAAASLLAPAAASAALAQGRLVPHFRATDLDGHVHTAAELRGRPTLLIILPSRKDSAEAKQWVNVVGTRFPRGQVRTVGIIALDLPFFIPESIARDLARKKIPERFWDRTWMGTNGDLADDLGVNSREQTFVVAIDASGKVRAIVEGPPNAANQRAVFGALK